ncbi:MAG: DUF4340 domain-containing protein [Treponema sp.]|jgi:hypothetical protein|nr:DUF4340 domain-containing protein [Treponema sp.]
MAKKTAKRLVFILSMAVLLGLLSLGLVFLKREDVNVPAPLELPDVEYLIDYRDEKYGGLESVTVRNEKGEYTILPGDPPVIPGWESLIVNNFPLSRIVDICDSILSRGLVAEDADPAVYGLDAPRAQAVIKTKSGEGTTLYIGNDVPDGAGIYVRLEDRPGVYQAGKWDTETFFQGVFDFVDKEISPQLPDDGFGGFEFKEIVLGGTARRDGPIRVVYEARESQPGRLKNEYRISGPIEGSLNMDRGYNILKGIPGLYADQAVARIDGEGDLARYGLAAPYSTASISGAQEPEAFSLAASKPDEDGNVYICREGVGLVYQAAASNVPWLEATWWDLMERMIILPFIDDIARVEVNSPQRRVVFTLTGEGDDLKVEAGGLELDTSFFRSYYQTLLSAIYDEYTEEKIPSGAQPIMEIVYHYRDGRPLNRVSFYSAPSRRVLTSLDGGRPFYTYSAYITKVQADLERLLEGQKVMPYL